MKAQYLRIITLCLILGACWLSVPATGFAQESNKSSCPTKSYDDLNNLPVAKDNGEYKVYCDITALGCQQTFIEKGLEFVAQHPKSQLCFPLYQKMVTAAIRLNNFDQGFELGRKALVAFPDHMLVMTQLATLASNKLLMGDAKYSEEGETYAHQALTLIQGGKMPYGYMNDSCQPYKTTLLGDLYQSLGIFMLMNNCSEDATSYLMRAAESHPYEPYTFFLLAKAQVQLYQLGQRKAIVNTDSSAKQPELLAAQILNTYAHASVLTENDKYKPLRAAIDYDMDILSKALPMLKDNFAQSVESVRNEINALATPGSAPQ